MTNRPWMKFYPENWRADPTLRMCSLAARGLWIEMICLMHEAPTRGDLIVSGQKVLGCQLAALVGAPVDETEALLSELEAAGVFSRDDEGTIYSRRMRRDEKKSAIGKGHGKDGGNPDIRRGTVPKERRVRPYRRSDSPAKTKRIFERSDGNCHWCEKTLDTENYKIDHIVAVRDGGTNDENNLVASCSDCYGRRAMLVDSDLNPKDNSDTNPYIDSSLLVSNSKKEFSKTPRTREARGPYAFEGSTIRLTQKDFDTWVKHFPHLSLAAELEGLDHWAGEQGKRWFQAVSGALAKREREVKTSLLREQANKPTIQQRFEGEVIPPKDDKVALARLAVGRRNQRWPRDRWGPAPGEDGCLIPEHLIVDEVDLGWDEWGDDG